MKIVNISGGLGNQMLQYAFAVLLQKNNPGEPVYIDPQHYKYVLGGHTHSDGNNFFHNGFEIYDVFPNASVPSAPVKEIMRVTYYIPSYKLDRWLRRWLPKRSTEFNQQGTKVFDYDPEAIKPRGNCCYRGIFGSVHFYKEIRDELLSHFQFPEPNAQNLQIRDEMHASDSVAIHVRRGDFLKLPRFANICTLQYYNNGIQKILQHASSPVFYIFSNDQDWCRENITPLLQGHKAVFVSNNQGKQSSWDMYLMSQCKYQIIANSTFSWWSAFLNTRAKMIMMPEKWDHTGRKIDLCDDSLIKLSIE